MADECDCLESCRLDDWSDQFVPATRELLVFTKSAKRYFDLDAVREPSKTGNRVMWQSESTDGSKVPGNTKPRRNKYVANNPLGSPPLDWWCIDPDQSSDLPERKGDPMTATFYVGDAIETMGKLPENSVDLVLTSPPFLALRSYLPADHPDKQKEGGSQATPGQYIDWLVDVVEACDRVLAPHGSLCLELGDTYSGSSGAGGDYAEGGMREGQETFRQGWGPPSGYDRFEHGRVRTGGAGGSGWPLAKSLSLIPELFRLTLVYGTNPLTGRTTERWRLRNVIRWVRPNPPVGALGDKFRPATSELMVFCKSAKRFFDLDAVREPFKPETLARFADGKEMHYGKAASEGRESHPGGWTTMPEGKLSTAGAPPLDWWNIPPGGYAGAHYAVWPPELCVKPIKAMSPEKVCRQCGEPSRRIVESTAGYSDGSPINPDHARQQRGVAVRSEAIGHANSKWRYITAEVFSDCGHDDWRPGIILDPFAGSGTTLAVATGHGRDAVGIDLDARNYDLALERVGPLILQRGEVAA